MISMMLNKLFKKMYVSPTLYNSIETKEINESKKQLFCFVYNIYYLSKVKRQHTVYNTWTTRGCLEIDGKLEI